METIPSESSRFRLALKQELPLWRTRGLIDDTQVQALSDLYRLDLVSGPTERSFLGTLVYFGVLLVGLGVLSFVAANWQFIPTAFKVALLLGAMWTAQGVGFYLWRVRMQNQALGHGLVVLGSLLYGANIGLFGQIFHLQGELYQALFLWGIGALAVAYALKSLPNAALAMAVLLGSYCDWSLGGHTVPAWSLVPLLGLGLLVPLSYRLRSSAFYQWTILLVAFGFFVESFRSFAIFESGSLMPPVIFALLLSFWLWVVASVGMAFFGGKSGGINRELSFWTVTAIGYLFSFLGAAEALHDPASGRFDAYLFVSQPSVLFVALTTLAGAFWLVRRGTAAAYQVIAMGICGGSILMLLAVPFDPLLAVLWMNGTLLIIAAYLIWYGLKSVARRPFLLGSGLCAWLALSRFFEYDTGLLVKSVAFVVVGVAVIAVAYRFEQYLNQRQEKTGNA